LWMEAGYMWDDVSCGFTRPYACKMKTHGKIWENTTVMQNDGSLTIGGGHLLWWPVDEVTYVHGPK